jgi:hypothetical protein
VTRTSFPANVRASDTPFGAAVYGHKPCNGLSLLRGLVALSRSAALRDLSGWTEGVPGTSLPDWSMRRLPGGPLSPRQFTGKGKIGLFPTYSVSADGTILLKLVGLFGIRRLSQPHYYLQHDRELPKQELKP